MWSFYVQFLSDMGNVVKYSVISAPNSRHAEMAALRGLPEDFEYDHVEVTRL